MSPGVLSQGQATGRSRRLWWWILLVLAGAVALQITFWGQPVATHYSLQQTARPKGADGAGGPWVIERRASPPETWHARDINGAGVMDELETPLGNFARPGLRGEPKRWLVICLDGVPLGVLQNLWDRGHFREFYRPSAVVSVFPSDSETALTTVLHVAPPAGYEHRYFDRSRNEIRAGAWVTLTGAHIPYIAALDYDPPGWAKALPYLLPRKTYRADLGRLRKQFLASSQRVFVAHISASDSLLHMLTTPQVEPFLIEFEDLVRELYLDARGEFGVLVFSDHGNTQTVSRAAPLEKFLQQRGWRLRNRLEGSRDVAVPAYGLIGFIAVYCQDDATASLARDLAVLEGVDLLVFRDSAEGTAGQAFLPVRPSKQDTAEPAIALVGPGAHLSTGQASMAVLAKGGATILSASGRAHLAWSADGSRFWYDATRGDPLELLPIFAQLRARGQLAANAAASRSAGDLPAEYQAAAGPAADADLFAATWAGHYPDAAARIRDWATNHVQNRANILVSLKPGYFYGAGIFQHIVRFTGTHGALDAPSSLGFAMATRPLPAAVRLADLLPREFLRRKNAATDKGPMNTDSKRRNEE